MIKRESKRIKQWQKVDYVKTSINKWELNSLKTVSRSFNEYDANLKLPSMNLKINAVQSNSKEKVWHPTQKPVALMEYLIKTYTNEWEIVLDFTCGSWSTLLRAKNTNRRYIWIELDEWYYNIVCERLK
jgi:site-specific DNA-methyltransferase (adenine-specific)